MPLFEYACKKCGNRFEYLRGSGETEVRVACPNCESGDVIRVFSAFSTISGSEDCGSTHGGGWSFG